MKFTPTMLTLFSLILISGCNEEKSNNNEFTAFAHHENMNDKLRESLFECLNTSKIKYKVDKEKNVLIKKKSIKLAVAKCS